MTDLTERSDQNLSYLESTDDKPEKKGFSHKQKMGIVMAGVALTLVAAIGIGSNVNALNQSRQTTKTEAPASPTKSPEKETKLSESETKYAEYLKTLSPEQRSVRESLNPDNLAVMNDDQLTEAFKIKSEEVVVDGKIDPSLYAEALIARVVAIDNSGISDKEYAKWGGLDKFGTNTIDEVVDKYFNVESKALFGFIGTNPTFKVTLTLGSTVDQIIEGKLTPKPTERYHYRSTVDQSSVESTIGANGLLDISFLTHTSDNWETDVMAQYAPPREPWDSNDRWDLTGIHITDGGVVLPTDVQK